MIQGSATYNDNIIFHSVTLLEQGVFSEVVSQAEWGTLYYAMQIVSNTNLSALLLTVRDAGYQHLL